MQTISRKDFLSNASMAAAAFAFGDGESFFRKNNKSLSFTTLGCPDWTIAKIVDFASKNDYEAIELRGILRELDLTKCPDLSSSNISKTMRMVKDHGLKIIGLGTSAHLHDPAGEAREKNIDEAKKSIDLAHRLDCPFIRVFPDVIPEGRHRNETFDLISKGLIYLADYASGSKVSVLLEPNGDVLKAGDMQQILNDADHPQVGMIWNVSSMWTVTKESPTFVYDMLKKYIKHTHIKDIKLDNGTVQYVLMGQGDVPVSEAVKCLYKGNYPGSYCCEWEKYWYPKIEDPEIAIAQFSKEIKKYFPL